MGAHIHPTKQQKQREIETMTHVMRRVAKINSHGVNHLIVCASPNSGKRYYDITRIKIRGDVEMNVQWLSHDQSG